jgi:hypothetical protein
VPEIAGEADQFDLAVSEAPGPDNLSCPVCAAVIDIYNLIGELQSRQYSSKALLSGSDHFFFIKDRYDN